MTFQCEVASSGTADCDAGAGSNGGVKSELSDASSLATTACAGPGDAVPGGEEGTGITIVS